MPYLVIAFAVTILVIMLAWRGVGTDRDGGPTDGYSPGPPRPQRPTPPRRVVAPDDDPEFLNELARKLREEGKSN